LDNHLEALHDRGQTIRESACSQPVAGPYKFILVLFGLLLAAGAAWYLAPHRFAFKDPGLGGFCDHLVFHSSLGAVGEIDFCDARGRVMIKAVYLRDKPTLFRFLSYGEHLMDVVYRHKNPEKKHWSRCVLYLLKGRTVILEDADQDGTVDRCKVEDRVPAI
jgi:hypothetical protein